MTRQQGVALVTGSASGIGREIAIDLAKAGYHIAVTDRNLEGIEQTVANIVEAGGTAHAFEADITVRSEVDAMLEAVCRDLGIPRVLVNNAGINRNGDFLTDDPATWDLLVQINFIGLLHVSQAVLRRMVAAGSGGRVVNIASEAGRNGSPIEVAYSGSKGAVISTTKSLARAMAEHKITVNCVSPGPVDTEMLRRQPPEAIALWEKRSLMGRMAQVSELAAAVTFLASEQASYITGQILSVNGGSAMAG